MYQYNTLQYHTSHHRPIHIQSILYTNTQCMTMQQQASQTQYTLQCNTTQHMSIQTQYKSTQYTNHTTKSDTIQMQQN